MTNDERPMTNEPNTQCLNTKLVGHSSLVIRRWSFVEKVDGDFVGEEEAALGKSQRVVFEGQ